LAKSELLDDPAVKNSLQGVKSFHDGEILRLRKRVGDRRLLFIVSSMLLVFGAVSLFESVAVSSSVLAFIGLGLTFWGLLFLFVRSTRYARAELVDTTAFSSLQVVDQIVYELGYYGRGIYIPDTQTSSVRLFVPAEKDSTSVPSVEMLREGMFPSKPKGFIITPPGLELAKFLREQMTGARGKLTLEKLTSELPHTLIDRLEIMEDFDIQVHEDMVSTKSTGSLYADLCNEVRLKTRVCTAFGCPMCSAIACLLADATGRPVSLEEDESTPDGHVIKSSYRVLASAPAKLGK
jgi:hypothetical protein